MMEKGHEVTLHQSKNSQRNLGSIAETGIINFNGQPVKIHKFTREVEEAVRGKDVIMLTIPATAVEPIAGKLAPYLEDGQYVFINSASSMSSMRFKRVLNNMKMISMSKSVKRCRSHMHRDMIRRRMKRRICERHRSEEHTSELQSRFDLVCRLLLEKKK